MRRCRESARAQGVNQDWPWFQSTLKMMPIYEQNKVLFDAPRGAGYWAWKPFIIRYEMMKVPTDCYLIYSDAGLEFIDPVQTVIDRMDQDIFLFGNEHEHTHWCKRDIIYEIMRNEPPVMFWKQAQASVIFFRVNDYTRKFVKEWLDWCLFEGGRLIDDSPSRTPNHPEFKENRHDQAILTTLAYREGIKLHEWYVRYEQYTPGHLDCYPKEFDRPLFLHHRKRNHEWEHAA